MTTAQTTSAAARPAVSRPLPHVLSGSRSPSWWAMLLVILNESIIFAALLTSYFYVRLNLPAWPPDGMKRPELVIPLINTALLVSSSFVMQWAQGGIRRGRQGRLRLGMIIALLLAGSFLALQIYEYGRSEFSPQTNVYGSLFFTITGIHGLHVLVMILISSVVLVRALLGHFTAERHLAVENAVLYWHFVDVVWLFILASVYLSPYV
ncbi:MAG: heme-copper oxidase subunit III [Ardenticatenaceae bacterium]|nr:heme-copper oxidase subunit III [Ardenticatenaceae bacterium]